MQMPLMQMPLMQMPSLYREAWPPHPWSAHESTIARNVRKPSASPPPSTPTPQVNKEAEHRERLQELQQRVAAGQERIFSGEARRRRRRVGRGMLAGAHLPRVAAGRGQSASGCACLERITAVLSASLPAACPPPSSSTSHCPLLLLLLSCRRGLPRGCSQAA